MATKAAWGFLGAELWVATLIFLLGKADFLKGELELVLTAPPECSCSRAEEFC